MKNDYKYHPDCEHICSSNCRREGCNCLCAEYHGYYEKEPEEMAIKDIADDREFSVQQLEIIKNLVELCPCGCSQDSVDCKCTPLTCRHLLK